MDYKSDGLRENDTVDANSIRYFYESAQARAERTIKRLIIALIMTIILLFLSNVIWLRYWGQYDFEEISYAQDGTGLNSINFGRQGNLNYEPGIDYSETETEEAGN